MWSRVARASVAVRQPTRRGTALIGPSVCRGVTRAASSRSVRAWSNAHQDTARYAAPAADARSSAWAAAGAAAAALVSAAGLVAFASAPDASNKGASGVSVPAGTATIARVMLPRDANPAGNVHGGTILELIESAGGIAAGRHANSAPGAKPAVAVTARVERMSFLKPMYVGNLARGEARVVYTSPRSMAVHVDVYAEDAITRSNVHTNSALLWYAAVAPPSGTEARGTAKPPQRRQVPQVRLSGSEEDAAAYAHAESKYVARKLEENEHASASAVAAVAAPRPPSVAVQHDRTTASRQPWPKSTSPDAGMSPAGTAVELAQVMLPSDCVGRTGLVGGGVVMKLMDNAAGVVAVRHCGTNVVTASVDAIDFTAPVFNGDLLYIRARPVFASARSMEIEINVEAERRGEDGKRRRVQTTSALYTFVSLDKWGRVKPLPPLLIGDDALAAGLPSDAESEQDAARFEAGRKRYEERKAARARKAAASVAE